ncbi:regulator [Roseibium sp. RKSG952]|uniref:regulator n=1 Tax=Roseibium sp. RKSG952 TaxID=2529384 RepID=UPI0012BBCC3A|nr:regulator [Roseibium sp. RKSG952]MTH96105.1 regulator [Roseibium sp. RKSG952]
MNDNDMELDPVVYIVIGRVWTTDDGTPDDAIAIHAMLTAADDDDAVRKTLEALSGQGYVEAELDQIGVMDGEPDDPTYEGAYQDALAGNVAVITFEGE